MRLQMPGAIRAFAFFGLLVEWKKDARNQMARTRHAIYETGHWFRSKGVENVSPMNKRGSQKVGPITVTITHAVHSCILGHADRSALSWCGQPPPPINSP